MVPQALPPVAQALQCRCSIIARKPNSMKLPLAILPLILAAGPAWAAPFADAETIDQAVTRFTGVPTGQPGGAARPIDRRLRLATCANPLSLGWYAGRRDTVLVQCPDSGSWRLFVPVLQTAAAGGANAVLRGESVTISVTGAGFTVSQPGEALEGGAVGAWIRVKTANPSAQPLRARVMRPGLVAVDLGSD